MENITKRLPTMSLDEKVEAAAVLDFQIKAMEKELKAIKEDLTDWYLDNKEKKVETPNARAAFSETLVFDTIDTIALYERLKSMGKADQLWHVVKPDVTALKKVMGTEDVRALQGEPTGVKVSIRLTHIH